MGHFWRSLYVQISAFQDCYVQVGRLQPGGYSPYLGSDKTGVQSQARSFLGCDRQQFVKFGGALCQLLREPVQEGG